MSFDKIDPINYPLNKGENWWIVHPNSRGAEFLVPKGAVTCCTKDFLNFEKGIVYRIVSFDKDSGWVSILNLDKVVEVPQYIFARYFDAEIFIRGNASPEERVSMPKEWID